MERRRRPPYNGLQLIGFCLLYAAGAWPLMSATDVRWVQAIGAVVVAIVALAIVLLISRRPKGGASVLALVAVAGAFAVDPTRQANAATWTPGCRHVYASLEAHAPIGGPNFFRVNTDSYGCWAANGYLTGVRLSAEVQIEYGGIVAGYEGAGHASLSSITHYHWSSSNPTGYVDGTAQNCGVVGLVPICSKTSNFRVWASFYAPAVVGGGPGLVALRMAVQNKVFCISGLVCELAFSPTATVGQGL